MNDANDVFIRVPETFDSFRFFGFFFIRVDRMWIFFCFFLCSLTCLPIKILPFGFSRENAYCVHDVFLKRRIKNLNLFYFFFFEFLIRSRSLSIYKNFFSHRLCYKQVLYDVQVFFFSLSSSPLCTISGTSSRSLNVRVYEMKRKALALFVFLFVIPDLRISYFAIFISTASEISFMKMHISNKSERKRKKKEPFAAEWQRHRNISFIACLALKFLLVIFFLMSLHSSEVFSFRQQ